jgi:phosphatidylglycerophosphate synthase
MPDPLGPANAPWDARLARRLVRPLSQSRIRPNHLTTVRLAVGLGGALLLARGTYTAMNVGALLIVISNFLDHTDGELARMTGKGSRLGHWYDLASDALVTILLFSGMGLGVAVTQPRVLGALPLVLGIVAGAAVALIFLLRMGIESVGGKAASKQGVLAGFETEDALYLLPLVTLCHGTAPFLAAAAIGAPLFTIVVLFRYYRVMRAVPE